MYRYLATNADGSGNPINLVSGSSSAPLPFTPLVLIYATTTPAWIYEVYAEMSFSKTPTIETQFEMPICQRLGGSGGGFGPGLSPQGLDPSSPASATSVTTIASGFLTQPNVVTKLQFDSPYTPFARWVANDKDSRLYIDPSLGASGGYLFNLQSFQPYQNIYFNLSIYWEE